MRESRVLTRGINAEPHHCHTLGADTVREDLNRVTHQKTRPSNVVKHIVDVNHGDHRIRRPRRLADIIASGADGPHDERHQHAGRRDEEELASPDLVNKEAHRQSHDQVEDLKTAVDQVLLYGTGVSD